MGLAREKGNLVGLGVIVMQGTKQKQSGSRHEQCIQQTAYFYECMLNKNQVWSIES